MAITTYTNLQTAIADWHHRDVSQIPDFIALAEKRINTLLRSRVAEVDVILTATLSSRYITLPTGFMSPVNLWMTTYNPRNEIRYLTPYQIEVTTSSGQPDFYTIDGANVAFNCPNLLAYTYTFRYKKGYDIAATSTNDILTNYPSVYLFGSLVEACLFARDDPSLFEAKFQGAIAEAQTTENENKANATLNVDASLIKRSNTDINSEAY